MILYKAKQWEAIMKEVGDCIASFIFQQKTI